jgi:hypothetical protein
LRAATWGASFLSATHIAVFGAASRTPSLRRRGLVTSLWGESVSCFHIFGATRPFSAMARGDSGCCQVFGLSGLQGLPLIVEAGTGPQASGRT